MHVIFPVDTTSYQFQLKSASLNVSFIQHLAADGKADDIYTIVTGDTQHWFECTPENGRCWAMTDNCNTNNKSCQIRQGQFANTQQKVGLFSLVTFSQIGALQISIAALIEDMKAIDQVPQALIINGDLTQFGQPEELDELQRVWPGTVQVGSKILG
jgi:hypothetical protein